MKTNPYEGNVATPETYSTRWMFVLGTVLLILATGCFAAAMISLFGAYQLLAVPGTVQPSELAAGISMTLVFSFATLPLGFTGVVFLILGFKNQLQPAPSA